MNEPKQTEQQNIGRGWAQLTLLDPAPVVQVAPRISTALRCPLCGAGLVHVIGAGLCDCPRCGAVVDL
jgi:ribosomal protein L37AE/L43A